MDKPWEWDFLRYNPSLTLDFIEKYMDKLEGWCENQNLTTFFVRKHIDKVDWKVLSHNTFKTKSKEYIFLEELEHTWWMPPDASNIPVFSKGGRMFHEGMADAMALI